MLIFCMNKIISCYVFKSDFEAKYFFPLKISQAKEMGEAQAISYQLLALSYNQIES